MSSYNKIQETEAMKIIIKKPDELIPYINNSRKHSDRQIEQVAASIKEFGFLNPVIIDAECGIIAGHCRVLAAKKLSIDNIPCIDARHLTKSQKKAYVIADNKLALNAEWDEELLKIEIESLNDDGFDVSVLGFDDEIDNLINDPVKGLADPDDIPEPPTDPKSKPGDIWILGGHRLMCGDSCNIDDMEKLCNGQLVDMWLTDPPYNLSLIHI